MPPYNLVTLCPPITPKNLTSVKGGIPQNKPEQARTTQEQGRTNQEQSKFCSESGHSVINRFGDKTNNKTFRMMLFVIS